MPKKVTKKINIPVPAKKMGFWVNKENLRKGERTIRTKKDKALVKRNRSGYEYDKTITGYEWTKAELKKKLADRAKKGLIEQKSILRDLTHTHRNTSEAPIMTASEFFAKADWNKRDVLDVDTPPGMTLKEIVAKYREEEKKPEVKEEPKAKANIISLSTPPITSNKLGFPEKHSTKPEVAFIRQVIKDEYKYYYGEPCKMSIKMSTGTAYGTVTAYGSGDSKDKGITPKEYFILKKLGFNPSIGGQGVMVLSDNLDKVTRRLDDFQKNRTIPERNIDSEVKELKNLKRKAEAIVDNEQYSNAEDWQRQRIRMIDKELANLTKIKPQETTLEKKYEEVQDIEAKIAFGKGSHKLQKQQDELMKEIAKEEKPKPKETSGRLVQAEKDDIRKDVALHAHYWSSFSPERRGEADRQSYVDHINNLHDELLAQIPPEKHSMLKEELERYKKSYLDNFTAQLHRDSRIASTMITGRSNFPTRTMQKRNDAYRRKQEEFLVWQNKAQQRIKSKLGLTKRGISSDDPEAVQKIDKKLTKLKANHEKMKATNKVLKSKSLSKEDKEKQLKEMGYKDTTIYELFKPDYVDRIGFPGWELQNNLANIKRLEGRKVTLERQRSDTTATKKVGSVEIEDNVEANRLRIHFGEKPNPKIISKLKSHGFKYSYKFDTWQRYRSNDANYWAKDIVEDFNESKKKGLVKEVDRSKSIAAGKNLYQEKYSPGKTHLAKTKTMTDMQKRRLIKACIDNEVDTRELDPSLKYDENQEIIQDIIEADDSQYRDESSKIDKKIAKLETVYYDDFGKERIKEREIDGKTTEEKVITKEDLSRNRKKTQLDQWKKEPYKSKIDVEEIDTAAPSQTD